MKNLTVLLLLFVACIVLADEYATTDNGKKVVLYPNGTWKYVTTAAGKTSQPIQWTLATLTVVAWKDDVNAHEIMSPKKGMRLVGVLLAIDNTKGDSEINVNAVMGTFILNDLQGYNYEVTMASLGQMKPELSGNVSQGDIGKGWVTFEVKKNVPISQLKIRYKALFDKNCYSDWIFLKDCKEQQ